MTIKEKDITHHKSLSAADFKKGKLETSIAGVPIKVKTRFKDDQIIIPVKVGIEIKSWFANWASMNMLIRKWGEDESKMSGKLISLELVDLEMDDQLKKIIYLKGAFKKP